MALTKEFKEAVDNRNMLRIRIMLKDSLLIDPSASMFDEMMAYLRDNEITVYDEYDGEDLSHDIADWNEKYMNTQMVSVVNNFSEERIQLLKQMVRYLYKDRIGEKNGITSELKNSNVVEKDQGNHTEQTGFPKKYIGLGLLGVGIIAIIVAYILWEVPLK